VNTGKVLTLAVLRQNFGGETGILQLRRRHRSHPGEQPDHASPRAIAAFAAHVGQHPDDAFASFHLKRLLNGASGVRIAMDHAPGQNRSPRP
jgi:hypothetical protein